MYFKKIISLFNRTNILLISVSLCAVYFFLYYDEIFPIPEEIDVIDDSIIQTKISYLPSLNTIDNIPLSIYYHHTTSNRNSSYPYISGDTLRAFSDYIYDEERQDSLSSVTYGDIVFVKTDLISEFFSTPFDSIQQPFVLITHNGDKPSPGAYADQLSNPKILHWFASNPSVQNHSKLTPIPIGLMNMRWPEGNIDKFKYAFKTHRKPWSQRTRLLYVNFALRTNIVQRKQALEQASKIKNVQIIKRRITFETYLQQIGNVKYVLSPPGNGLDCHRTWEALFMGAVPIVLTSDLDPVFTNTRSLIVNNWSNLTRNHLLSFDFSMNDHLLPDVLYAQYWREKIFQYKKYSM
jgi:hypothetical protein